MAGPKRATLDSEQIVDAAIELIGNRGLDEFSMPQVAASLGVRTSWLYRHFADRTAVLAAVARRVTTMDEAPEIPPPGTAWTEFMVAQAIALQRNTVRYPNCSPLIIQVNTKGRFRRVRTDVPVPHRGGGARGLPRPDRRRTDRGERGLGSPGRKRGGLCAQWLAGHPGPTSVPDSHQGSDRHRRRIRRRPVCRLSSCLPTSDRGRDRR